MAANELKKGVFMVGARDWNRRLFDALIPLPHGTTYNSYLVKGKEKTALIDTVNPGFEEKLGENISKQADMAKIDFLIMNHAEPDHAGSIPYIMEKSKAVLVATEKGAKMAQTYYGVPEKRIKKVKDGDTLKLGGKTLKFIEAPWLHWPETMFTYLQEDKILFPCDFFGAHTAAGTYDEDVPELLVLAKDYFGEIMMPFRLMGAKGMEKIAGLEIEMIAPSHGPVYRNPKRILGEYGKWTKGETREKAVLVYVTMWKHTEEMMDRMADTLIAEGIEVKSYNLTTTDLGDLAGDLVDSRAIVLGTPTVLGGMHPLAIYAVTLVKALHPPLKYGAFLSSYGWGGGALRQAQEMLGPTGIEMAGAVEINGPAGKDTIKKIAEIGKALAGKIRG